MVEDIESTVRKKASRGLRTSPIISRSIGALSNSCVLSVSIPLPSLKRFVRPSVCSAPIAAVSAARNAAASGVSPCAISVLPKISSMVILACCIAEAGFPANCGCVLVKKEDTSRRAAWYCGF